MAPGLRRPADAGHRRVPPVAGAADGAVLADDLRVPGGSTFSGLDDHVQLSSDPTPYRSIGNTLLHRDRPARDPRDDEPGAAAEHVARLLLLPGRFRGRRREVRARSPRRRAHVLAHSDLGAGAFTTAFPFLRQLVVSLPADAEVQRVTHSSSPQDLQWRNHALVVERPPFLAPRTYGWKGKPGPVDRASRLGHGRPLTTPHGQGALPGVVAQSTRDDRKVSSAAGTSRSPATCRRSSGTPGPVRSG